MIFHFDPANPDAPAPAEASLRIGEPAGQFDAPSPPRLLDCVRLVARTRHYSQPMEDAHVGWQNRRCNEPTGEQGRHHHDRSILQRAVLRAAIESGQMKRATCQSFRVSCATHLLEPGYDLRTVHKLREHRNAKTTMTYTHVLQRGGRGVKSPANDH